MTLSQEGKKNLVNSLPFPLSYLYQELIIESSWQVADAETKEPLYFWKMIDTYQLLLKLVGIFSLCSYFQASKSVNSSEAAHSEANHRLSELLKSPTSAHWLEIAMVISQYFNRKQNMGNRIPELTRLLEFNVSVPSDMPKEFPYALNPLKAYSWFEAMNFFLELDKDARKGIYRFHLPSREVIQFTIGLLEETLNACRFLQEYGIYVLVGKDARKTRGFLCQGTRSKPVGIRGISNSAWLAFKGRPFLCPIGQKQYLSLFPFFVPLLQKYGDRTAFLDLLIYEYTSPEKITFYGHRSSKLGDHTQYAQGAFSVWQKELRHLEGHSSRHTNGVSGILHFPEIASPYTHHFVGRSELFGSLFETIRQRISAYLYVRAPQGYGKTAFFSHLYREINREQTDLFGLWDTGTPAPIFAWHFCSSVKPYNDPLTIAKSLYGQILLQVYNKTNEETEDALQKLPGSWENLQKYFCKLLADASEDVLRPKSQKLVIAIDSVDYIQKQPSGKAKLASFLPQTLPDNVFFLLSWQVEKPEEAKKSLLPSLYCQDSVPLYPIHSAGVKVIELKGSPLGKLSSSEVLEWLRVSGVEQEDMDYLCEWAWKKSEEGDPLYFAFLEDSIEKNRFDWASPSLWPSGRYGFMNHYWENLPSDRNLLAYKISGFLSVMDECGDDFMFSEILEQPLPEIQARRWLFQALLQYRGADSSEYKIYHPALKSYILNQFYAQEKISFHRAMADYYCKEQNRKIYKYTSEKALYNLASHYYGINDSFLLYTLALDDNFKEEKIQRFKSYYPYLDDIMLALQSSLEQKKYEYLLTLGYRYYEVVFESLQSVAHAFHAAEHGNYELALQRIRALQDEHDLFKGLLLILWYALDNEHYSQIGMILEEIRRIPSNHVAFITMGIEPLVSFILEKLKQYGIGEIDAILTKNGLHGQEAFEYLFSLHQKIKFNATQLKNFFPQLIDTIEEMPSSSTKKACLEKLISLWAHSDVLISTPSMWQEIKRILQSQDISIRIESLQSLAQEAIRLSKKEYLEEIKNFQKSLEEALETSDDKITNFVRYAGWLILYDEKVRHFEWMNRAFDLIEGQNYSDLEPFFYHFLNQVDKNASLYPEEYGKLWSRLYKVQEGMKDDKERSKLQEKMLLSLSNRGKWEEAFKLLKETQYFVFDERVRTLKTIARNLREINSPNSLAYWGKMLEQTTFLSSPEHRADLLCDIANELFELKIAPDDILWNRYISACDLLKDFGSEQKKNAVLAKLSSGFAQRNFLTKAQSIISKLSDPLLRSEPLAELAIKLVEQEEWEGSVETLEEVVSLEQRFRVFEAMSSMIPKGDDGRSYWKKLTLLMKSASEEMREEKHQEHLNKIIRKLASDLPLDEAEPFWNDIFEIANRFKDENARKEVFSTILTLLKDSQEFEKTVSFWSPLYAMAENFRSTEIQTQSQIELAASLGYLGNVAEASPFFNKAIVNAEKIQDLSQKLALMGQIAVAYSELGELHKSEEIFEKILEEGGITQKKNGKKWNYHQFIMLLISLRAEVLARNVAEKILLSSVETGDKVPPPECLANMASLCIEAGYHKWARVLFFRILPLLNRDDTSISSGGSPLYIKAVEILEKMAKQENFHELWEHTEEMVLNFPKVSMQERCMDMLALSLSQHGTYHEHQALWEKLLHDACYVGKEKESLSSLLHIGKHLIKVISWDTAIQLICKAYKTQDLAEAISKIVSDYDKVTLMEIAGEMMLSARNLEEVASSWNKMTAIPKKWKKTECIGIAMMQFSRILARHHSTDIGVKLWSETERLLEQISKPAQKYEGYLVIASEYCALGCKEDAWILLQKILEIPNDNSLMSEIQTTYANKLLPGAIQCLIQLKEYEMALRQLDYASDETQVWLKLEIVKNWLNQNEREKAKKLLDNTIFCIPRLTPEYGDLSKAYGAAAIYLCKMEENPDIVDEMLEKAFSSWNAIVSPAYQKDGILHIVFTLRQFCGEEGKNPHKSLKIWQRLIEKAEQIQENTYRMWAMQKIAETMMEIGHFSYFFDVMIRIPAESDTKIALLSTYGEQSIKKGRMQEAFQLLQVLVSYKEKSVLLKKMADALEEKNELDLLFSLYMEMPGDFSLICYLTTKILAVALRTKGSECFYDWTNQITDVWGLAEI